MTNERFSYSKLNTYRTCPFRFKLSYRDNLFVADDTIATAFGTLVHYVEECIAKDILACDYQLHQLDDNKYINLFLDGDSNEHVLGIYSIKEKFTQDFYALDKSGKSYADKGNDYLNYGIYQLRDFLTVHPEYKILGIEQPFSVDYNDHEFHGFIDRILLDTKTDVIHLQDIKTWNNPDTHDLKTPLQFVIYSLAVKDQYSSNKIQCEYVLPLINKVVAAGSSNFLSRGCKLIDKSLDLINQGIFNPKPSPLCFWCPFSHTYPNQDEKLIDACPYACNWTKDKRDFSVRYEWLGLETHQQLIESLQKKRIDNKSKTEIRKYILRDSVFQQYENKYLQ